MKHSQRLGLSLLAAGILILSGCAFGDRHVMLEYPLVEQGDTGLVSAAEAAELAAIRDESVVLVQFTDLRANKELIGEVLNAYGMRTADVYAENDARDWITDAIRLELENAGYTVVDRESAGASPEIPVLSGEVLTVFCTAYFSYDAEISFLTRVEKGGEEILTKRYSGTGTAGVNWAATERSYGESLSLALSNAIGNMIADLEQLQL
jgi:hypothetical protein